MSIRDFNQPSTHFAGLRWSRRGNPCETIRYTKNRHIIITDLLTPAGGATAHPINGTNKRIEGSKAYWRLVPADAKASHRYRGHAVVSGVSYSSFNIDRRQIDTTSAFIRA